MKRFLVFVLTIAASAAMAANWYVRPGGAGTGTGADWNNAANSSTINSKALVGGDTVWIAGGSYTAGFTFTKGGTAGNILTYKRVRSTDAVPVAAAGWSAAFDAQVRIDMSGGNVPLYFNTANISYVTVDGQVFDGIFARFSNAMGSTGGAIAMDQGGNHDCTFLNIDLSGPGPGGYMNPVVFSYSSDAAPISMRGPITTYNIYLGYCRLHSAGNLAYALHLHDITFDHCMFYDNVVTVGTSIHANIFYVDSPTANVTVRFCDISGWQVEGFAFWDTTTSPMYFYGNVVHDHPGNSPNTLFWPGRQTGTSAVGPLYFYDNICYNIGTGANSDGITSGQGRSVQFTANSQARNNIYWQSTWAGNSQIADSDYNAADSSSTTPGVHSLNNIPNPFVAVGSQNFHITSTVGATAPKDKGIAVANVNSGFSGNTTYDADRDGNTRGADGSWDIGAYEYVNAGGTPPAITAQPSSTSGAAGSAWTLALTASGSPTLAYQWYAQSNATPGCAIASATSQSYTKTSGVTGDTTNYCCLVTNLYGAITSSVVNVTVTNGTAPILALDTLSIDYGVVFTNTTSSVIVNITNIGTGTASGTVTATGQWSIPNGSTINLAAGASQTVTVRFSPTVQAQTNGTVSFSTYASIPVTGIGLNQYGTTRAFFTNGVVITPMIAAVDSVYGTGDFSSSVQGSGECIVGLSNATPNNVVSFNVSCESTNTSNNSAYFKFNGEPVTSDIFDSTNIHSAGSGLVSEVLTLRGGGDSTSNQFSPFVITLTNTGPYYAVFRGRESNFRLASITVVSTAPAVIQGDVGDLTATVGNTATFTVGASGTAPIAYQWAWYGTNVTGATSSSWTTPALTLANSGSSVTVAVSNSYGSAASRTATLTVNSPVTVGTLNSTTATASRLIFGP